LRWLAAGHALLDSRAKWLRTAAGIFGLVYKAEVSERGEISIDLASEQRVQPMSDSIDPPAPALS